MFDTLKYSRVLESVGISRDQAEAHVRIIAEIVEADLATKQDIRELKDEMVKLEYRLIFKLSAIMATIFTVTATVLALVIKSN